VVFRPVVALLFALALCACDGTVDSLGHNGPGGIVLKPISGPASYPNAFRDVLGKTDVEIAAKIAATFDQLFHGAGNQTIYFPEGTDQAYIQDVLHGDVRTEGIGLGMMVTVQLNKRDEFDKLWRYAKTRLDAGGAAAGYFKSRCDTPTGAIDCLDPYGQQQFLMALLLAKERWVEPLPGGHDYGADAIKLLDVMRYKQDANGGIVDGVTNMFDATTRLAFDEPDVGSANTGRPSIALPAYYDLWAQATGDPYWTNAASSARAYLQRSAHPMTGLLPVRALFDGTAVTASGTYQPEAYRAQINMTLDEIWSGGRGTNEWNVEASDRLLTFFSGQGVMTYGSSFQLNGMLINPAHNPALVAVNGTTALIATRADRAAYIGAVWDMMTPIDAPRYFIGIMQLVSLLILAGQFQVF
jgi:oligosaccharide reducing-end xylanase